MIHPVSSYAELSETLSGPYHQPKLSIWRAKQLLVFVRYSINRSLSSVPLGLKKPSYKLQEDLSFLFIPCIIVLQRRVKRDDCKCWLQFERPEVGRQSDSGPVIFMFYSYYRSVSI